MASITLRNVKGSALTFEELDSNFSSLNNELLDAFSYDSGTSTLTAGRIGTSDLTADLTPITDKLPDSLSFNTNTNVITVGRVGTSDLTVDLSSLDNSKTLVTTAVGIAMSVGVSYHLSDSGQTMTLPSGVTSGASLELGIRNFDNTVVSRNGNNIMGLAEDITIDRPYALTQFTFIDSSYGWYINL